MLNFSAVYMYIIMRTKSDSTNLLISQVLALAMCVCVCVCICVCVCVCVRVRACIINLCGGGGGWRWLGSSNLLIITNNYEQNFLQVSSLVSTATDVLLEILEMKLSFVQEALHKLSTLVKDNPKSLVPPELGFSRYEEWLETNQRLFELNSQLYDLEKLKFEIQHKKRQARTSIAKGGAREGEGLAGEWEVA